MYDKRGILIFSFPGLMCVCVCVCVCAHHRMRYLSWRPSWQG